MANSSSDIDRREALKTMGAGAAALTMTPFGFPDHVPPAEDAVKITKVKAIVTCPHGIELIVVKVETDQPGLYGVGCATFRQRAHAVVAAVNEYLDDFCRGRDVDNIEDIWQMTYVSSYWRNGPVLNNALSGLDQALWDIKGKRAGMPVYQLLGGKCRFAVPCYSHASGRSPEEAADSAQNLMEQGFKYVRIQLGGYGSTHLAENPDYKAGGFGMPEDNTMDEQAYVRGVPKMFEATRKQCGEEVELLHDIHERLQPLDAIRLIKLLEPYRPFFIEDPFSPENNGFFEILRQHTHVPISMGELFNNPHEWVDLMSKRLIDYIRIHISQIGGITPALKVARLGEWFNVRTAWHGPGDVSPSGHAANAHIGISTWNFGIQEAVRFSPLLEDIFPGCPKLEDGYWKLDNRPGLGVDVNEELAAKYPLPEKFDYRWTQVRRHDGTPIRP